jgi:ketosteroid isomerase-like protein
VASAKPVVDPYASAKADVSERVMMWALALSAKNLEQYVSFYAPLAGASKSQRREMQRQRMQMRQGVRVDVQIDDLELMPQSDGTVVTRFKQRAQSQARRTAVLKQLRWRKFDAGWLITHESNG